MPEASTMVSGGSQKKSNVPNTTCTEVEQSSRSQRAISRIQTDSTPAAMAIPTSAPATAAGTPSKASHAIHFAFHHKLGCQAVCGEHACRRSCSWRTVSEIAPPLKVSVHTSPTSRQNNLRVKAGVAG